jgi:hypothetical protein
MYARCTSCSGRHDPGRRIDPYYIDDRCRCTEGVLQYRLQNGRFIIRRFPRNPFSGVVITTPETGDEREWNSYLEAKRNELGDPTYDPIRVTV